MQIWLSKFHGNYSFPGSNRAIDCSIEKFGARKHLYFQYFALPPFFPLSFSPLQLFLSDSYPNLGTRGMQPKFFHVRTTVLRKKIPGGRRHIQWINYARELPTELHAHNQAILMTRSRTRRNIRNKEIMETSARALAHGIVRDFNLP